MCCFIFNLKCIKVRLFCWFFSFCEARKINIKIKIFNFLLFDREKQNLNKMFKLKFHFFLHNAHLKFLKNIFYQSQILFFLKNFIQRKQQKMKTFFFFVFLMDKNGKLFFFLQSRVTFYTWVCLSSKMLVFFIEIFLKIDSIWEFENYDENEDVIEGDFRDFSGKFWKIFIIIYS